MKCFWHHITFWHFWKKSIFSYIGDFPNFNQFFVIHMTLIVQEIVQIRSAIFLLIVFISFFWPFELMTLTFDLWPGKRVPDTPFLVGTNILWVGYRTPIITPLKGCYRQTDTRTDRQTDVCLLLSRTSLAAKNWFRAKSMISIGLHPIYTVLSIQILIFQK